MLALAMMIATSSTSTAASTAASSTAATSFLDVDGGRIAFDDVGPRDGALVVCVPGLGDVRQEYRFLAMRLVAQGHRVVTMDLRGHGGSTTTFAEHSAGAVGRDVVALLRHVGANAERPATLIGTSMGAAAVSYAASVANEQVAHVVLIGPFVRDVPTSAGMKLLMRAMFGGPWRVAAWMAYLDSLYPTRKPADWSTYRAALAANLRQTGRFDATLAMMNASKADVEARLGKVTAPTLVVMGTKDPDFADPGAEAALVRARFTSSSRTALHMIEGAGHYPHAEMPDETAQVITAFLAEKH